MLCIQVLLPHYNTFHNQEYTCLLPSETTPYNLVNGQYEWYNEICQAVTLAFKSQCLPLTHWEFVLQDALYSIFTLLLTSANATLHQ